MPDQLPPHSLTETELSARLHDLAAHGTAPATAAQVRSRAAQRRRNRRALLSTTAVAAAAVTVVTSGAFGPSGGGPTAPPAASRSHAATPAPSPAPAQRVTIDLNASLLNIGGEDFGIARPSDICPIGETEVTVTAKYPTLTMPVGKTEKTDKADKTGKASVRSNVRRWAVTFTDSSHHERLLLWALPSSVGLVDVGHDTNPGSIALPSETGKFVYDAIKPGAHVKIKGWQAANAQPDSVCSDRRPITGTH